MRPSCKAIWSLAGTVLQYIRTTPQIERFEHATVSLQEFSEPTTVALLVNRRYVAVG